jgi:endo-1,4-beta-xylanase
MGLDACFKSKGKLYWGTCGDIGTLQQEIQVIQQHFGQVTPENAMKAGGLHLVLFRRGSS